MEYLITILIIFMSIMIGLHVGNWLKRFKSKKPPDKSKRKD